MAMFRQKSLVLSQLTVWLLVLTCLNVVTAFDRSYISGGRIAFSQKGINYLSHRVKTLLHTEMSSYVFKEAHGKADLVFAEVDYTLSHIVVNMVEVSMLNMTIVGQGHNHGLYIHVKGAVGLTAKFAYQATQDSVLQLADSGILHIDVERFDFHGHFEVGVAGRGDQYTRDECTLILATRESNVASKMRISKLHVRMGGKGSDLYDTLPLDSIVKLELESQARDHFVTSFHNGILHKAFNSAHSGNCSNITLCRNIALSAEEPVYHDHSYVDLFFEGNYYVCGKNPPVACINHDCPLPALPDKLDHMVYEGFNNITLHSVMLGLDSLGKLNQKVGKGEENSFYDLTMSRFPKMANEGVVNMFLSFDGPGTEFIIRKSTGDKPNIYITIPLHRVQFTSQDGSIGEIHGLEILLEGVPYLEQSPPSHEQSFFSGKLHILTMSLQHDRRILSAKTAVDQCRRMSDDTKGYQVCSALVGDLEPSTRLYKELKEKVTASASTIDFRTIKSGHLEEIHAVVHTSDNYVEIRYDFKLVG